MAVMRTLCVLMLVCLVTVIAQKGKGGRGDRDRDRDGRDGGKRGNGGNGGNGGSKPGQCPIAVSKRPCTGYNPDRCKNDYSCPNQQKCCNTGCFNDCVNPIIIKPPGGRCPIRAQPYDKPCPANPYHSCKRDRDCKKGNICCLDGCSRQCVRPRY